MSMRWLSKYYPASNTNRISQKLEILICFLALETEVLKTLSPKSVQHQIISQGGTGRK